LTGRRDYMEYEAICTGCGQTYQIGPQAEAIIVEGGKGYCAIVKQWVVSYLAGKDIVTLTW
jgi:hypothetical protein